MVPQLLEMGGWGDSATRLEQRRRQREAQRPGSAAAAQGEEMGHEGDVYMNDEEDTAGVWDVEHVLDASFDRTSLAEAHVLSIEVPQHYRVTSTRFPVVVPLRKLHRGGS